MREGGGCGCFIGVLGREQEEEVRMGASEGGGGEGVVRERGRVEGRVEDVDGGVRGGRRAEGEEVVEG